MPDAPMLRRRWTQVPRIGRASRPLIEINAGAIGSPKSGATRGRLSAGGSHVRPSIYALGLAGVLAATAAQAGDVEIGRQIAQSRCAVCHVVGEWRGDVFADAPPFQVIARKFPADGAGLIVALRGPHEKMNFRPSYGEADDIVAYIRSLSR